MMNDSWISSAERFDQVRTQHPELAVSLYALTPGSSVTLEVITPDGQTFVWSAATAAAVLDRAFPPPAEPDPTPPDPPPSGSIFD